MTLLAVNNLTLSFTTRDGEKKVVSDVSFNIEAGEMFALVGESGSGKTLSALATIGLAPAAAHISGSVRFEEEELIGAPESRLRHLRGDDISMIFQEPMTALNPLHTIGKQIAEMIVIHKPQLARKAVIEQIESLLDEVGLVHLKTRLDAYPHQLSGGERQRVMIAMAIANNPKLLIADEPTTAVDVTVQAKILKLLKHLQKERNMAMLFITHDLTIVQKMADKVAIMRAGEMVEQGAVAEVFSAPKHTYTQTLLGSAPKGAPEPLKIDAKEVLTCEKLSVHYPIKRGVLRRTIGVVKAADDISFTLKSGETLGVVGESGSGKTTLGLALLKLAPAQGKVIFQSREISLLRAAEVKMLRQQMQIVFQDPFASLNPRMTVGDIVAEGLRVHAPQLGASVRDAKVVRVLQEVGLIADSAERYPHEFSGGQRQRIAIARALILEPSLLILDEPTSALDLTVQTQIVELLRKFQREQGLSYIFISHDLRVVKALAHRIIVMQRGRMVEKGEATQILNAPTQSYTQELMKAAL